ncbi:MAG: hypothetical protein JKY81_05830 [Colwellia sp.]|nr:hypothetical protein [Colwellia sp.]
MKVRIYAYSDNYHEWLSSQQYFHIKRWSDMNGLIRDLDLLGKSITEKLTKRDKS